jgi:hypothetical protein
MANIQPLTSFVYLAQDRMRSHGVSKNIDVPESEGKPKAEEEPWSCVIGGQIVTLSGKEASENHQEKLRDVKYWIHLILTFYLATKIMHPWSHEEAHNGRSPGGVLGKWQGSGNSYGKAGSNDPRRIAHAGRQRLGESTRPSFRTQEWRRCRQAASFPFP